MFTIYTIIGCPYCENAVLLLKKNKLKFKNIIAKTEKQKQKYKEKHDMYTFPQVFFKSNKKNIKIGGYADTLEFIDLGIYLNSTPFDLEAVFNLTKKLK